MNKLFFKIFISFWVITVVVALTMFLASYYFSEDTEESYASAWELTKELIGTTAKAEYIIQYESYDRLAKWLKELKTKQEIDIKLSPPDNSFKTKIESNVNVMSEDPIEYVSRSENTIYYSKILFKDDKPIVRLLLSSERKRMTIFDFFAEFIWLRLLAAILASGLICFFMARRIARPIVALRKATRSLAEGNLDTRYDKTFVSDQELYQLDTDEVSELGKDFNYMAERLQETIDEQKQLVRDISHELRSPLGRIQAALALAQRKSNGDSTELVRVEKECDRLNELIGQLLIVPNSDSSLSDVIDLIALVKDIASDDEIQVSQQGKAIKVDTLLEELLIKTSGNLLWHAIDNVVRNAIRHTPEGSTVTIKVAKDYLRDAIKITVSDEGPGVPSELLEKIFHPFYRVETAREHGTGYGLGLSIASRSVARHGGRIEAHNSHPGLEVEIYLPDQLIKHDD